MRLAPARLLRRLFLALCMLLATFYGVCTLALLSYTLILPPVTTVQIQQQVGALFADEPFPRRYAPVPRSETSSYLPHAVVAAEDARFYKHNGIDWQAVQQAVKEARQGEDLRGGSTITQQLVKNLFLTTHSNFVRKGLELPLTYLAELILSKERILTLYVNVVEWDRGIYGAEAAARHYFDASAAGLSRWQSAALAACLPAPRQRSPHRMQQYTSTILARMSQMGW